MNKDKEENRANDSIIMIYEPKNFAQKTEKNADPAPVEISISGRSLRIIFQDWIILLNRPAINLIG
jgi:hypothetical protein